MRVVERSNRRVRQRSSGGEFGTRIGVGSSWSWEFNVVKTLLRLSLLGAFIATVLGATDLQPGTLKAWGDYIGKADSRMRERLQNQRPFLWSDEGPTETHAPSAVRSSLRRWSEPERSVRLAA